MVAHATNGIYLVSSVFDDTDYVCIQFLLPRWGDETSSVFHGEDVMNEYLGVGVGHVVVIKISACLVRINSSYITIKRNLLTENVLLLLGC